jgi:hypothetical protein
MTRRLTYLLALAGCALAAASAAPTALAATNTFSGRAFALGGTVEGIQVGPVADTGNVSPGGESLHACLLAYPSDSGCALGSPAPDVTGGALKAEVLHAAVVAQGNASRSDASLASLALSAAGQTISAEFLAARAKAECNNGTAAVAGSSELASQTLNGQHIAVTGAVNQTVLLPGIGSIVINEQVASASANKGDITVRALHIVLTDPLTGKTTDLTAAFAHADIACAGQNPPQCPNGKDFVTGGGFVAAPSGAKGTFGVAGGLKNGSLWGHLVYDDHGAGMRVKGTGVTAYTVTGPTSRHIEGTAEINGQSGFSYQVDVNDAGEPGRGADSFTLRLSNGYGASGTLGGGNIQLHLCK